MKKIGIIGAGAWGTALATVVARNGLETVIWAREADVATAINDRHENTTFLPGIRLAPEIRAVTSLGEAAAADALLLCVPAQFMRAVTLDLAPDLGASTPVVNCAKGIEQETMALMGEIIAETLPGRPLAVLSGPTFAAEVAHARPTAVTLAAGDERLSRDLAAELGSNIFRIYLSDDPVGAQIGGAVKNVLAIACGIVVGRELGENGRAALITRGLTEIVRFGAAKGAKPQSLMGLAGLGDLVLTCTSAQSRNYSLGVALGHGEALDAILKARSSVAEGAFSAAAITAMARKLGIDMPICFAVDDVLNRGGDIDAAIADLLSRPFTTEVP